MQKRILILGATSFVATGLYEYLVENGYQVDCFSRGQEAKEQNFIRGDVFQISTNRFLSSTYDTVINYIVIKDGDINQNIEYIKSVISLCKSLNVKRLIHFSSIMVYDYQLEKANEKTAIEELERTYKKGYGEIKIAVDQYLISVKNSLPFETVIVRPGYVLADNRPCPFIKKVFSGISVIKGNKKSKQPIVRRDDIHVALQRIIETENNHDVYHFFPNDGMTKYQYAKQSVGGLILTMPELVFRKIPYFLSRFGIFPKSLYSRFEGMYIKTDFDSTETENKIQIKFR